MPNYPIHRIASAPEGSKPAPEQLRQAFVLVPNLAAIANSPKLVNSLVAVFHRSTAAASSSQSRVNAARLTPTAVLWSGKKFGCGEICVVIQECMQKP